MVHNLCFIFQKNPIYFMILSFTVQIMSFTNLTLQFKYKPGLLKVSRDFLEVILL